jgi:hypothetical protein
MFPGMSDLCDWGTGGIPPNGQKKWTERTAGNPYGDRRGFGSSGPFTFHPGDVEDLDLAFGFARDYNTDSPDSSLSKLMTMVDVVRNAFISNKLPDGTTFNGISEFAPLAVNRVTCYPNPANTTITIRFENYLNQPVSIRLINTHGIVLKSFDGKPATKVVRFDVSSLPVGLYLVNIQSKDMDVTKKVSVMR